MATSEDGIQRFVDVEPHIDYLAKDYASFRQLMLDHLSVLVPGWQEESAADLGNVLIEVLAYAADYLSYFQDGVGTEAYLGTARLRRSVRRHARLLDYFMHEGCNARVWVQIAVNEDTLLHEGTLLLTHLPGLPTVLDPVGYANALQRAPEVFATLHQAQLFATHNAIPFYTENPRTNAVLPIGATRALLQRSFPRQVGEEKKLCQVDHLQAGDVLIFNEIRHPQTGRPQRDPKRRHAVRLVKVTYRTQPPAQGNANGTPPIEIEWAEADALPFALHIAPFGSQQEPVSVAHGNIVLADHGRWITDEQLPVVSAQSRYRPTLRQPDLTHREAYDPTPAAQPATATLQQNPRFAMPVIQLFQKDSKVTLAADRGALLPTVQHALQVDWQTQAQAITTKPDAVRRPWHLRRDLLNSDRFSLDYVVEMEEGTRAALRFGFGDMGKVPAAGDEFVTRYRIGNGSKGNIGPDTIHHLVVDAAQSNVAAKINAIWNPLPAQNGVDPEPLEEVRIHAPYAYKEQEVCVTAADYAAIAMRYPGVYQATAVIQWIGTWQTVRLYVRRADFQPISPAFRQRLRAYLEPFRYMGHELLIGDPMLVPLVVSLRITLKPGQQQLVVQSALSERLSAQRYGADACGFFHPANFAFGQSVFQSKLVAAVMAAPGVASVVVEHFRRMDQDCDVDEILIGPLEVAQLLNRPDCPQQGRLTLKVTEAYE